LRNIKYLLYLPPTLLFFIAFLNLLSTGHQQAIREWLLLIISTVGIYLLWRRAESLDKSVEISQKTADDKAFLEAITIFKSTNEDSRIGAILALGRIATENKDYRKQIFKVFFGFIRNNSNHKEVDKNSLFVRPDVVEIMDILKDNPFKKSPSEFSFDGSHLAGFTFIKNDFKNVSFNRCNLYKSTYRNSDFTACSFVASNLQNAKFVETDLLGANFYKCKLNFSLFFKCKMPHCNFGSAVLIGAKFQRIEKDIFSYIIMSLKQALIVHKNILLCNEELFFNYERDYREYAEEERNLISLFNRDENFEKDFEFDTEFPDYIEVVPLPSQGFDLKLID